MKVLILPEDQHHDQYIVKPVVAALFDDLGVPARVDVLPEPRLRGSTDALDEELIARILADNVAMTDLFVLIVDRDCNRESNAERAAALEHKHSKRMIACAAIEEVETWLLALHRSEVEARAKLRWSEVRAHCDPKETFALPLLESRRSSGPGAGRKEAMRALKGQLRTLLSLCDELAELRSRIEARLRG